MSFYRPNNSVRLKPAARILHLAVETAATQTKPAYAGYNTRDFQSAQADFVSIAPDFESEGILLASGIPVSRPQ